MMTEGSAPVNVIQPLIDLQDTDGLIRELEREARDIPQRKAQEIARLNGVNAALEIAKNQLAAMQQRIKSEEAEAEQIRARVRDLKTAQLNIKSNKEMQQSIMQIEGLERDAEAAENRALALEGDEIPVLEKRVAEAQAKVDADKGGIDGYLAELDERLAEVKAELERLAKERNEKAAEISKANPRQLLYYERQRTKRWPVVVTLNHDGVCDGCHMKQPPFVEQLVQHNKDLVACTMCGRILYRDL
jgi:predicted  nucleic acid-binding Zn-ribbon protein